METSHFTRYEIQKRVPTPVGSSIWIAYVDSRYFSPAAAWSAVDRIVMEEDADRKDYRVRKVSITEEYEEVSPPRDREGDLIAEIKFQAAEYVQSGKRLTELNEELRAHYGVPGPRRSQIDTEAENLRIRRDRFERMILNSVWKLGRLAEES